MMECDITTITGWEKLYTGGGLWWLIGALTACTLSFFVTLKVLNPLLNALIVKRHPSWKKVLGRNKPFRQLAFLFPVLVAYFFLTHVFPDHFKVWHYINAYIFINITLFIGGWVRTAGDLYDLYPISRIRPLKSYFQLAVILIYVLGGIGAICELLALSPMTFITGAVAVLAAVLLVFRDTILSFIASMQIAANNLIRKGDWIEVKEYGADGEVIDIALHVIRVQNFDKTIVSIPTYKVMEAGFRNWRGMFESGGRQIKRSVLIDQTSVAFLTTEALKRLKSNPIVTAHLPKEDDIEKQPKIDEEFRLTNLGLFREYLVNYLKDSPDIRTDMTLLVRHLGPTPEGIPIQVYAYCSDTEWVNYEGVQADIFEHILALLPLFGLKVFQSPMDLDTERLNRTLEGLRPLLSGK